MSITIFYHVTLKISKLHYIIWTTVYNNVDKSQWCHEYVIFVCATENIIRVSEWLIIICIMI